MCRLENSQDEPSHPTFPIPLEISGRDNPDDEINKVGMGSPVSDTQRSKTDPHTILVNMPKKRKQDDISGT